MQNFDKIRSSLINAHSFSCQYSSVRGQNGFLINPHKNLQRKDKKASEKNPKKEIFSKTHSKQLPRKSDPLQKANK
jgi:hypothetical protein